MIKEIENLPDVSFIDGITLDTIQSMMVEAYQDKYREVHGKDIKLRRGDSETLKLYACSVLINQAFQCIEKSGRMGLLKYAYSSFLDNLGALRGVTRLPAYPAKTRVRFMLHKSVSSNTLIPAGTRVSDGNSLYFATDEVREIPAGNTYVDVPCTCLTVGTEGNGVIAGLLNNLVDPIPYIQSVSNIEESSGGSNEEKDDEFVERIYLAPSGYSVAGSEDAYEYFTKSFSSSIGDVDIQSPNPCEVVVRFLLSDGSIPSDTILTEVANYLSGKTIRPLTDQVIVTAPTEQSFDIELTYYINRSDADKAVTIQDRVTAAVEEYITWQTGKIGRDINPSVLIEKIISAGAKRVDITAPTYDTVSAGYVSRVGQKDVVYGGIEDD